MTRFDLHERVIFSLDGEQHRGRVTGVGRGVRRVVTDAGRRLSVPVRELRSSPDRALILETRLDRSLRSTRSYGPMMQQWLTAYDVIALYERVHTVEDMRRFLRRDGQNRATRFIHIMSHGIIDEKTRGPALQLTFEKLHLDEHADVFAGLEGKVLIFSSCRLGERLNVLRRIKEVSGAAAVIGYRRDVEDFYTNLVEVLLYDRLIRGSESIPKMIQNISAHLPGMNIRTGDPPARKPVLVCV